MTDTKHYKQERKRNAEIITPPNVLKQKVGSGGLSPNILKKAQSLLEENTADFKPMAEMYLQSLHDGLEEARHADLEKDDYEIIIGSLIFPTMQLKANGGMFNYQLISQMSEKLIHFLEVIEIPDRDSLQIVGAFHTSMRAVVSAEIRGDGGSYGKDLLGALIEACYRYFEKHPLDASDAKH